MQTMSHFEEVLEVVETLPLDDQEILVELVRGHAAHALGDIRDVRTLAELERMAREDQGAMLNGTPVAGVAQYAVNNIRNSMAGSV